MGWLKTKEGLFHLTPKGWRALRPWRHVCRGSAPRLGKAVDV